jgi:predicted nucleotidyltransferase
VLDLKAVDLQSLCEALEDHSEYTEWWLDPETGEVEPWPSDRSAIDDVDDAHPAERNWVRVEPLPSREGYQVLVDFTELVRDPRTRELLERAMAGRGAFRRFKDTLFGFPELREAWFRFHDARLERRALRWLADEGLVEDDAVEEAIARRPDPELSRPSSRFDADEISKAVADDLRRLYGDRLRRVILFGSWARGDAHPESDVDLLVVLDGVGSPWEELERMDSILDRHSVENETLVTAMPVGEAELANSAIPAVIRATTEGRAVA